jgi:hypothetical protein
MEKKKVVDYLSNLVLQGKCDVKVEIITVGPQQFIFLDLYCFFFPETFVKDGRWSYGLLEGITNSPALGLCFWSSPDKMSWNSSLTYNIHYTTNSIKQRQGKRLARL